MRANQIHCCYLTGNGVAFGVCGRIRKPSDKLDVVNSKREDPIKAAFGELAKVLDGIDVAVSGRSCGLFKSGDVDI